MRLARHRSLLLVVAGFSVVASGCLSTSLLYHPNVYQTGDTAGKGHCRFGGDATLAPVMTTDADSAGLSASIPSEDPGLALGFCVQYGVASKADVGLGFDLGFQSGNESWGVRGFTVIQVVEPDPNVTIALMPEVFFIEGNHAESGDMPKLKIESRAYGGQLHVPASLRLGGHTDFTWVSRFVYLRYEAPFEYHAAVPSNSRTLEEKHNLVGGGLGIGLRYRFLHPELSVLFSNNVPLYAFGLSVHN